VKLSDLEGQLYRYSGEKTFSPVNTLAEADSVMFLCPACFAKNSGPIGTHGIRVDFEGRSVPDEYCIRNSEGNPVRWNATGTSIGDLSLTPSILLLHDCAWHGFVTNGDAA
jgi:hypothetical protein